MTFVTAILVVAILAIIVIPLILLLPEITIDTASIIQGSVFGYIRAGMYFLPAHTVVAILELSLLLFSFRILVAVVKTVWQLPL